MRKIALLIGVTKYGEGFSNLPAPKEDVEKMSEILNSPDIGNFSKVTPLINPDVQEMRYSIEEHFDSCQSEDLVLFYFSGHGYRDIEGKFYFLSRESCKKNKRDLYRASALEASFIHDVINNCKSSQQIIILDCCFSGSFERTKGGIGDDYEEIGKELRGEGRVILTSSRSSEPSYESKLSQLSVYTHHLVAGLETKEADKQRKGYITAGDLHEYVKENIKKEKSKMSPQRFITQNAEKIIIAEYFYQTPQIISETIIHPVTIGNSMNLGEVIRAVSCTIGGLFWLFFVAPWLYTYTVLSPLDVDIMQWIPGSYTTGATIVFSCSLITQVLWIANAVYYKGDDREAKYHEKYWYLGLAISVMSIPMALFFTTFGQEGSLIALHSLVVIFAIAVAAIYWLATAASTPGVLKFIVPYSLDIRRIFERF
ncbi:MAG: caspase family protein [Xenococcus sp. MO_188.B8]|nr:caspase family protein [Xenococcus sp. MO_188.B8]